MAQKLKFGNGTWATKEGSTLAYNDENNNYKPLPFTTTRNSIATRVNKEGLIEVVGRDAPRIDYLDSEDGVFLLEKASTNLITYSEDFSNAAWHKSEATIESGYLAPDGTLNAFKVSGVIGFLSTTPPTTQTTTRSIYARTVSGIGTAQLLSHNSNTNNIFTITEEWQRFDLNTSGLTGFNNFYAVDFRGSSTLNEIILWGGQAESGNLSSYIPTNGSTVTRQADTASGAGNDVVFNDSEGVLFADISAFDGAGGGTRRIEVSNGVSATQYVRLQIANGDGSLYAILNNGSQQFLFNETSFNATLPNKISLKYKENDFSLFVNGFEVGSSNVGNTFANGVLRQANFSSTLSEFYGKTKELGYYDTALTDEELEYMTSYRTLRRMAKELNLNKL